MFSKNYHISSYEIKEEAKRLGFDSCGITPADYLEEEAAKLEGWLKRAYHGEMSYMERNIDKRLDPRLLMEGARNLIVVSYNYYPVKTQVSGTYRIARYAYGQDYHQVVKDKLRKLTDFIRHKTGDIHQRVFVDTAPLMEKAWAVRAGLGWQGKNSLLIQKRKGSYFSLGVILTEARISPDKPFTANHCGSCNLCVEACPTDAILPELDMINASRCISYLNTELKGEIPAAYKGQMADYIFGCDICQEVCPWNKFSLPHNEPLYDPHPDLLQMNKRDWEELKEVTFREIFRKSSVKRRKYTGLIRVIRFNQSS